jgi:preprotein translocase subunit YajC
MFNTLLQTTQAAEGGSALMSFLPFILIIVVFYFFMIRPQQKRQKELNKMRDELSKGTQVMTNGGIYGKVAEVKDNIVVVEIADGVKVSFDKSAIATVVTNKN